MSEDKYIARWWVSRGYDPVCKRCSDSNDIGHEPGVFTDALGYGPNCPDCNGKGREQLEEWFVNRGKE